MNRRTTTATVVAVAAVFIFVLTGIPRPAAATLVIVPNASFENPNVNDNTYTDTVTDPTNAIPNWTFQSSGGIGIVSAGVWDPANADYSNTGGNNTLLPGTALGGQASYIYLEQSEIIPQDLVGDLTTAAPLTTIQSDMSYTLTVSLGRAKRIPTGDVTLSFTVSKFPIWSVVIPAGTIAEDTFADYSMTLTTFPDYPFAGAELSARITHSYSGLGVVDVEIDNVRFEMVAVPEPASTSAALLTMAMVATRLRRRRRRG